MSPSAPEQKTIQEIANLASQSRTDQLHLTLAILLEKSGKFAEAMLKLKELYQHVLNYQHAKGDSYHAAYSKAFIETNMAQGTTNDPARNLGFFLELLFSKKLDKDTAMPFIQKAYANLLTNIQYKQQKQEVTEVKLLKPIPIRPALTPSPATTHDRTNESEADGTETSKQKQAICQRSPSPTYSEISDLTANTDNEASSSTNRSMLKATSTKKPRRQNTAKQQQALSKRLANQSKYPWCKSSEHYPSADRTIERAKSYSCSSFINGTSTIFAFSASSATQKNGTEPKYVANSKH